MTVIATAAPHSVPSLRKAKLAILALALMLVTTLWIAAIHQIRFERRNAIEVAVRQNEQRVRNYEQYVLRTLDAANVAMDHIVVTYGPDLPRPGVRLRPPVAALDDYVTQNVLFSEAFVATENGTMIASTEGVVPDELSPVLVAAIRKGGLDGGALYVSRPMRSKTFGEDFIYLIRRLPPAPGQVRAVAVIAMSPAMLLDLANNSTLAPADMITVVGSDGVTRARQTGDRISAGENLSGSALMRMQASQPIASYRAVSVVDHIERYFSYRRLPDYTLIAASGVAVDSVFGAPDLHRRVYLVSTAVLTLTILVVAALVFGTLDERDRHDRELDDTNRRLLEAQLMGQIGEWEYDPARDIVSWSPSLRRMYGNIDRAAASLEEVQRCVGPEEGQRAADAISLVLRTGERRQYEKIVSLADGSRRVRQVTMWPKRASDGTIVGIRGTDQDITTSRRLESLESKVVHLSRLDAMNLMAATLAHEINQPLAAAANYMAASRRMLDRIDDAGRAEIEETIRSGESQVRNAGAIIRSVRQMVTSAADRQPVAILEAWKRAAQLVEHINPDRVIRFDCELAPGAASVVADKVQIGQVFTNLLRNAVDATPEGPVRIALETEPDGDGMVRVSVRDNGHGGDIAGHDFFAPLATTKEVGLGLGLIVSRTIVEAHGGKIWIDATGPGGTTVVFTLPTAVNAATA